MGKVKICPGCGQHNPPNLLECPNCEEDMTAVPITDEEEGSVAKSVEDNNCALSIDAPMVKICDACGSENPVQARRCVSCGEDLTMIAAVPKAAGAPTLTSLDGAYFYVMDAQSAVIGRAHSMGDYLSSKPYVSRKHAILTVEGGAFRIQDCGGTNGTFVNNRRLNRGETAELRDGDEIGLGGNKGAGGRQSGAAYFRVCT